MTITNVSIAKELEESYLLYSYSIFNRALPSVVDGLKTAQRRIILGLNDLALTHTGSFKKVSRLEGHVLGNYHPNGGCASTAINMGQASAFRYPLTDIHGNVGGSIQTGSRVGQCIDDSPPAAARYLEIKSTMLTDEIFLKECDHHVSNWKPNYDATTTEISEFVPSLPMLLINGATGIATGYAATHVPYNAERVINAVVTVIKDPNTSTIQLKEILGAPDFPHYPQVLDENLEEVIETGSGVLKLYGEWEIKKVNYKKKAKREAIIITSLASGNSEKFVEMALKGIESEKITNVAEIRNLSSRYGIEIHVVLKSVADSTLVLDALLKHTNLHSTIGVNATGLVDSSSFPRRFGVKEIIQTWLDHRIDGLKRRFLAKIESLNSRVHLLDGFLKVSDVLSEVLEVIRSAKTSAEANSLLRTTYKLDKLQADFILNMSLKSLINTEVDKIHKEKSAASLEIKRLNKLINKKSEMSRHIISEVLELKKIFKDDYCRSKLIQQVPK
jgi:DNA gyrase subunit A